MPTITHFFRGLSPRYVWKDNKIHSQAVFVGKHEETEAWMALFLDLVYACLFSKVSELIGECEATTDVIIYCACIVLMFFMSRLTIDEYAIRFYQDDLFHRLLYLVYTLGILIMVMNVDLEKSFPRSLDNHFNGEFASCTINNTLYAGLSYGHFIVRFSITCLYIHLMLIDETNNILGQFGFRCFVLCTSTAIFLITSSVVEDKNVKLYLLILISMVEVLYFFVSLISNDLKKRGYVEQTIVVTYFPINIFAAQKRLGFFFVIALGEAMISILQLPWEKSAINDVYLVNCFGLLLIFSLAMQYYEKVFAPEGHVNCARRDMYAGVAFIMLHAVVAFFISITAQGIVGTSLSVRNGNIDIRPEAKLFLAYGCALTSYCLTIMRILHKGFAFRFSTLSRCLHLSVVLILCSTHIFILHTNFEPRYRLIFHSLIATSLVAFDVSCDLIKHNGLFGFSGEGNEQNEECSTTNETSNFQADVKNPLLESEQTTNEPNLKQHKQYSTFDDNSDNVTIELTKQDLDSTHQIQNT